MSTVPYTFAGDIGNIPLSQLDTNFANVKLSVDYVIQNTQANITSVGTLTSLSVSGNVLVGGIASVAGNVVLGNISVGNISSGNLNSSGAISAAGNITGANIRTAGSISAIGNAVVGNLFAGNNISVGGNVTTLTVFANTITAPSYNAALSTFSGNMVVGGNLLVSGSSTTIDSTTFITAAKIIRVANNATTSSTIDNSGIFAGNPTVSFLIYSHANVGWSTANNFSVGGNSSVGGNLTVTGSAFAATPANATANTQIATTAFVRNIIPTGVITLWYGSIASIPAGWFLCDGGNGTPDLRDRFIVGAGSTYAVGATGGSANAVVVSHTHTASVTDPGHLHSYTQASGTDTVSGGGITIQTNSSPVTSNTGAASTGISVTNASTGVSGTNANLPPYYALAYIMKA